jgi:hypothetical protein
MAGKMDRRSFLVKAGLGSAGLVLLPKITGCSDNSVSFPKIITGEFQSKVLGVNRPVMGSKDAKVFFLEFSDPSNSLCVKPSGDVLKLRRIYSEAYGTVNFAHFNSPLNQTTAKQVAMALEAAANQSKYFAMFDAVYKLATFEIGRASCRERVSLEV